MVALSVLCPVVPRGCSWTPAAVQPSFRGASERPQDGGSQRLHRLPWGHRPHPRLQTAVASLPRRDAVVPTAHRAEGHLHPAPRMLRVHGLSPRGCVELHHCGEKVHVTPPGQRWDVGQDPAPREAGERSQTQSSPPSHVPDGKEPHVPQGHPRHREVLERLSGDAGR